MIDKTPTPKAQRDPLPSFLPVPRQTQRHDGWTPERQRGFIEALADTGSVKAAAHAVNMTPEGAYLLRRHPEGDEFRKAWENALRLGVQRLEDVAMDRALNGVEVPVYHFGAVVGSRRVYNDRLLMFILRNRAPKRFKADGRHDANTRGELRKLKNQWRKEWERERALLNQGEERDAIAEIDAMLDQMRERELLWMSPATREAHDTYLRLQKEDEVNGYNPYDDPNRTDLSGAGDDDLGDDGDAPDPSLH